MFKGNKTIKGYVMMSVKMLLKFTLVLSTVLASIISSSTNFITETLPIGTSVVRYATSPLRVLFASVFLTTKSIVAFSTTEMVRYISLYLTIIEPNGFTTSITRHYREGRVIPFLFLFGIFVFKMNSITGKRASPSNFGLFAIGNKFLAADFAYQLCHNYIIAQYPPLNKGKGLSKEMKAVYQTKSVGIDAPIGERGNCWQAAVASILELPLEEVPDIQLYDEDMVWFDRFRKWLEQYNLSSIGLSTGGNITIQGYHLIECKSATLKNGELHVVVGLNQEVVHDPNPNATSIGEVADYIVFTALNPAQTLTGSGR